MKKVHMAKVSHKTTITTTKNKHKMGNIFLTHITVKTILIVIIFV
jgi:hypothetical protein